MKNDFEDIRKIAYTSLMTFGFEEEAVVKLVEQAIKDLKNSLNKLELQINSETIDKQELSDTLHAIKGLLFQMGDHNTAEQINEIREDIDTKESIENIKKLLLG